MCLMAMAARSRRRQTFEGADRPAALETVGVKKHNAVSLFLAAEAAHRVTGIASFILLADIGDQRFRALHLNFEGSDQRIFRVNDNVFRLPLNL
jgi:hypothetical protein